MEQITVRLSMPYDAIIASSIVGTEVGGLPGSRVDTLKRCPETGLAIIDVDVPDDMLATYTHEVPAVGDDFIRMKGRTHSRPAPID